MHSPRVGMAQDLSADGAELPALMTAGRWTSPAQPCQPNTLRPVRLRQHCQGPQTLLRRPAASFFGALLKRKVTAVMGKFLEEEKRHQIRFKGASQYFTKAARPEGPYRGKYRPFCLPVDRADENLFRGIRAGALDYFKRKRIKWHDGRDSNPSNHLCSSQVQCVNFLYPFADKPEALCTLQRPIFPDIESIVPMEGDGQLVSFEWIGLCNYLGEKIRQNSSRTRGANFTSADAAVMFRRQDGTRQIVLIEWKYTESYSRTWLGISKSGTDRREIYRRLYDGPGCPVEKAKSPGFSDLFYEPFYQFLRQQLLAHEMEQARELGCELVTVLHIAPASNRDFHKVTSPGLQQLGDSSIEVWKGLVRPRERFLTVSTEALFGDFPVYIHPELADWLRYISERYPWLQRREAGEEKGSG